MIPVLNVDGYSFSRNTDRMWRKNRQPNANSSCVGTDINRNFNSNWGDDDGASTEPCNPTYSGASAESAPETKAWVNYMKGLSDIMSVLDLHSYTQKFMYPYAYKCGIKVPENDKFFTVSKLTTQSIQKVYGTQFDFGGICDTIYKVSGDSIDYSYDTLKAKYPIALELRDTGKYGFLLPPNQIIPSGEELLAGLLTFWNFIIKEEKLGQPIPNGAIPITQSLSFTVIALLISFTCS
ncbi:hypothetical protein BC833DRAFT_617447 [Globomyces pollinis-pini]|nr:hypothetical protein BC833DRAFT_617447 [Globomyces pollinis-pini]